MLYFWIGLAAFCLALLAFLLWCGNNALQTSRYTITVEGVENDVKIVHLSDLHGKAFGQKNSRLIAKILQEKPDFIAVTGDIIDRYSAKNKRVALELVSALSNIAPVLYASGNHEMRNKGYRFLRKDLKEAGATVLDDEFIKISGVTVFGLNCASQRNGTALKLAKSANADGCKILLAHKPHFIENYLGAGFDLVLSGHAHGGQWRIPFTKQGIYAPGQGMFPKLTCGVKDYGKTKLVISRGLGNSQCPIRLFNRPEIVVINLKSKTQNSI